MDGRVAALEPETSLPVSRSIRTGVLERGTLLLLGGFVRATLGALLVDRPVLAEADVLLVRASLPGVSSSFSSCWIFLCSSGVA